MIGWNFFTAVLFAASVTFHFALLFWMSDIACKSVFVAPPRWAIALNFDVDLNIREHMALE